jgi:hypothetical protein
MTIDRKAIASTISVTPMMLLGGALDARRVNGGFRVHARLPYGGRAR